MLPGGAEQRTGKQATGSHLHGDVPTAKHYTTSACVGARCVSYSTRQPGVRVNSILCSLDTVSPLILHSYQNPVLI